MRADIVSTPNPPFLSLVVATYRRPAGITALLGDLEKQQFAEDDFEVVVVDDGSPDDTRSVLEKYCKSSPLADRGRLKVIHQKNGGQASARQTGVEAASGQVLLFTDDDMRLPGDDFLSLHAERHRTGGACVVLGKMLPPPGEREASPYELHFERTLERLYEAFESGKLQPGGQFFFTGNVSLPKALFLEVGGFDRSFTSVEDKELGLRLERTGKVRFEFEPKAVCHHHSDRNSFHSFSTRAVANGEFDWKIVERYPDRFDCSPAAMMSLGGALGRATKALLRTSALARRLATAAAKPALALLPKLGLRRPAQAACSLLYNACYITGVAKAAGTGEALRRHLGEYAHWRSGAQPR